MKILNISSLGALTFIMAGCIGHSHDDDTQPSSSLSSLNSSVSSSAIYSSNSQDTSSTSSAALSSSSENSSISSINNSSSSLISSIMSSTASSSSSVVIPISSSTHVSSAMISSSSSSVASSTVNSSSSILSSSSISSSVASSTPMVNIEDLKFNAILNTDQSIQTDSIENLGSALIGLIDQEAFNTFYLSLIAQGLDEAAVAKAISVLGPIGNAIAADFIQAFSGQALLPAPAGINLVTSVTPIGSRGVEYSYTVNQTINDVNVSLNTALRFETSRPSLSALIGGRTGYNVFLDGLNLVINEMNLSTSEVTITLDTSSPIVASSGLLDAQVELTPDGSGIVGVTFNGDDIALNLGGTLINGIIGVEANAKGSIDKLNATLDLVSGSSTISVTQPDINIDMQGIDAGNSLNN